MGLLFGSLYRDASVRAYIKWVPVCGRKGHVPHVVHDCKNLSYADGASAVSVSVEWVVPDTDQPIPDGVSRVHPNRVLQMAAASLQVLN